LVEMHCDYVRDHRIQEIAASVSRVLL